MSPWSRDAAWPRCRHQGGAPGQRGCLQLQGETTLPAGKAGAAQTAEGRVGPLETQRGWPCREGGYGALKGVFISEKTVLTIGHPGYTDGG